MNNLERLLKKFKKENKKVLSVFLTAGFPDIKTTGNAILKIANYADLIELGVPFSDPIADGPTIQYSSQKALKKNIDIKKILSTVKNLRKKVNIPIIVMGYLNPIYNFGLNEFFKQARNSGVDGVIIPDLTYEESHIVKNLSKKYRIAYIPLVALTTDKNRAKEIARTSTGFIYVTAVTGVTGARKEISRDLIPFLKTLKNKTSKPLMVGFGISKPEHIKKIKKFCDGFIVGSAVINLIRKRKPVETLIKQLKNALT
ncbi:MAG: tryptophan synthase subunit alpha [Elusimicrobia bacterium]|nr:tryptophan synthase subunit alpha [Elusimicrobiota bacterium]